MSSAAPRAVPGRTDLANGCAIGSNQRGLQTTPNQMLQQTGHANDACARHYGSSPVSRLLSWAFGKVSESSDDRVGGGGRTFLSAFSPNQSKGFLNMSRWCLCCLALMGIASVVGCADKGTTNAPAGSGYPEVERRLKNAIDEQGKHRVKSVQLTKQPDGRYAGTVQTESGDTISVKGVIVRDNGISWDETIDQTGKGTNRPRADAKAAKEPPPPAKPPTNITISSRPKADWAPGKFKVGDYVEYVGPDGQFRWSEEIQEVGDHCYVYLRIIAVDDKREQQTFKAKFERDPSPTYGTTTKKVASQQMMAGDKSVQADLIETYDDRKKVINKKWVSPEVPFNGLVEERAGDDRLLLKLAKVRRGE
jgi:hypothetical protein